MSETYDAIIVGAGPAGSLASMFLKKAGKSVLLIDKATFPRDKICGDATGRKLAGIMKELGIYEDYRKLAGIPIYGIRLSSPNGTQIDMDLIDRKDTPGFIIKRMDLDNFLYDKAKEFGVQTMENTTVQDIIQDESGRVVEIKAKKGEEEVSLKATIFIGADGAHSVFARKFNLINPPEHLIVALRAYYKGVKGLDDKIELHLIKDVVPGYFWIFPLPNGEANVGIGMVTKEMSEKKINLRDVIVKQIAENPLFKERFAEATLEGDIVGWNLPVASHHRKCYGNGFLLAGDAASLIDPLSGEGVGTAAISAKHAAQVVLEALEKNDVSENFLKKYDKVLWDEIGHEIKADYRIQKLGKMFPFLIDKIIEKSKNNEEFRKKFESMLPYQEGKEKLGTWRFIAGLLK